MAKKKEPRQAAADVLSMLGKPTAKAAPGAKDVEPRVVVEMFGEANLLIARIADPVSTVKPKPQPQPKRGPMRWQEQTPVFEGNDGPTGEQLRFAARMAGRAN